MYIHTHIYIHIFMNERHNWHASLALHSSNSEVNIIRPSKCSHKRDLHIRKEANSRDLFTATNKPMKKYIHM